MGTVAAIKAAKLRIPATASPAEVELANRALERIVDVMDEKVSTYEGRAFAVLTAARHVREEVCGKVADRVDVTHRGLGELLAAALERKRAAPK